jgi:hypothetical protein
MLFFLVDNRLDKESSQMPFSDDLKRCDELLKKMQKLAAAKEKGMQPEELPVTNNNEKKIVSHNSTHTGIPTGLWNHIFT